MSTTHDHTDADDTYAVINKLALLAVKLLEHNADYQEYLETFFEVSDVLADLPVDAEGFMDICRQCTAIRFHDDVVKQLLVEGIIKP
jgi:hypothetical protein